jgi:hypothetical protein
MKLHIAMAALVAAGALGWDTAAAQSRKADDCVYPSAAARQRAAAAPERVQGEVVSIDRAAGMVTMRLEDGQMQQFHASQETLDDLKVGARIEARKRDPKC